MSDAICIIPARGGSRRIPRKNLRHFFSRPIIAYSISCAQKSGAFGRVVVSTDDDEIAGIARFYGAEAYMRLPEFGRDEVGTQHVVREAIMGLDWDGEYTCCMYATAPFAMPGEMLQAKRLMENEPTTHYIFTVGAEPDGIHDAAQWYFGRTDAFISDLPLVSQYTRVYPIPASRVCDINTAEDWARAECMFAAWQHVPGHGHAS